MNSQKSLLLVCTLVVVLSGKSLADESADKKIKGVRKAIDVCIELLEKRDFEGFVNRATHPSRAAFLSKTDESLKRCLNALKRDRDEIISALKVSKTMKPVFQASTDPNEEKAVFVFEKSILRDREVMLMQFRERDGVWYFLD